ncbi:PREDICTED: probable E3 ubiquitin-protein ligase XERICO [Camelina sativa]|uniref:Probable E3 ubiquitin-protein ligase XERICO n=1 Tax=Camelina sativa TaxID=90675 RepID=A0ABM0SS67_CAMSA|nr:PREDICTED: probable E3 ubiquitin-protein ligase XERICO [Camelina sativa]
MGLSHYPTASDGVVPMLVMNTVVSVSILKNMVRSVLQVVSSDTNEARNIEDGVDHEDSERNRISITHFDTLCVKGSMKEREALECCVCLCGFKEEEEVSELVSCKHYFHTACLDKWFGNNHTTCPLCRSIL